MTKFSLMIFLSKFCARTFSALFNELAVGFADFTAIGGKVYKFATIAGWLQRAFYTVGLGNGFKLGQFEAFEALLFRVSFVMMIFMLSTLATLIQRNQYDVIEGENKCKCFHFHFCTSQSNFQITIIKKGN
uniref:Uncharacterized protein n=1 Tax=Anopheles maculatus TaxID=74869 RepID=A0A182SXG0_9DIPT